MKSRKCSFKQLGQRSITSTSIFRPSKPLIKKASNAKSTTSGQQNSRLSLSDFLSRKLHRSQVLPSSVQGKHQSPLCTERCGGNAEGGCNQKQAEAESKSLVDGAFHLFKNVRLDKKHDGESDATDEAHVNNLQNSEKPKFLFEDYEEEPSTGKRVAVLGEVSRQHQKVKERSRF